MLFYKSPWDERIKYRICWRHKYQQCSAIQIQPDDFWLNLECQRCHSPSVTTIPKFFLFPCPDFFQREYIFWLGQLLNLRKIQEKWNDSVQRHSIWRLYQFLVVPTCLACKKISVNSSSIAFSSFHADLYLDSQVTKMSYFSRNMCRHFLCLYWAYTIFHLLHGSCLVIVKGLA